MNKKIFIISAIVVVTLLIIVSLLLRFFPNNKEDETKDIILKNARGYLINYGSADPGQTEEELYNNLKPYISKELRLALEEGLKNPDADRAARDYEKRHPVTSTVDVISLDLTYLNLAESRAEVSAKTKQTEFSDVQPKTTDNYEVTLYFIKENGNWVVRKSEQTNITNNPAQPVDYLD